jgi:hypothetical protein
MYDIIRKHRSKGEGEGVETEGGPGTCKDRVSRKVNELG